MASDKGHALVDPADVPIVAPHLWSLTSAGYPGARIDGRTVLMHRLLCPSDWTAVDHANGDKLDNRRINLRAATKSQNGANIRPRGASGYKGVTRHGRGWAAALTAHGTRRYLGTFDTAEDAARAYDTAALAVWGDYARLNLDQIKDVTS